MQSLLKSLPRALRIVRYNRCFWRISKFVCDILSKDCNCLGYFGTVEEHYLLDVGIFNLQLHGQCLSVFSFFDYLSHPCLYQFLRSLKTLTHIAKAASFILKLLPSVVIRELTKRGLTTTATRTSFKNTSSRYSYQYEAISCSFALKMCSNCRGIKLV